MRVLLIKHGVLPDFALFVSGSLLLGENHWMRWIGSVRCRIYTVNRILANKHQQLFAWEVLLHKCQIQRSPLATVLYPTR